MANIQPMVFFQVVEAVSSRNCCGVFVKDSFYASNPGRIISVGQAAPVYREHLKPQNGYKMRDPIFRAKSQADSSELEF